MIYYCTLESLVFDMFYSIISSSSLLIYYIEKRFYWIQKDSLILYFTRKTFAIIHIVQVQITRDSIAAQCDYQTVRIRVHQLILQKKYYCTVCCTYLYGVRVHIFKNIYL